MLDRVQEVYKLLLAGAEFAEISQYASERHWNVGERQVRRYMEIAYRRMADSIKRDRKQLLGRHLMQRRSLYARCLKNSDLRTALQTLRDEADLQGLYPPTKIAPTTPDGTRPYPGPALTRRERLVRILVAEQSGDRAQMRLLEETTRYRSYRLPDTQLPVMMLHTMTLMYVNEQLEHATTCLLALWNAGASGEDETWDGMAMNSAYLFKVGREAWRQFTEEIGVDGGHLVRGNCQGLMLDLCGDNICNLAPSADELRATLAADGHSAEDVVTAARMRKSWRRLFAEACGE
jgi:hypothetical protein